MNKWQCDTPGCTHSAVGVGGGRGLRALGWQFIRGKGVLLDHSFELPRCYCPMHRTDLKLVPCAQKGESEKLPCNTCTVIAEAERLQSMWPNEGLPTPEACA